MDDGRKKPVIALMGEFSAGKSTLANILIGSGISPVKVTATQLPPVWFKHGAGNPVVVDLEGNETEIPISALDDVSVGTTAYVRVFVETELLELIDLIDMPGNSDPNMSAEVWRRALHHADGVIWCSHATQAWRQSEAAVWEDMPEELHASSIMLLTRWDKIKGEVDRARLLRRVESEAGGMFRAILPISLLDATEAGEDRDRWEASGADAFLQVLLDVALGIPTDRTAKPAAIVAAEEPQAVPQDARDSASVMPRRVAVQNREPGERRAAGRPGS